MNHFKAVKLGIIGGGQLGKMLIQEAVNLNAEIYVLDPDKDAPCRYLAQHFECGSLMDFDTVYHFGKRTEILTVEIEHINTDALLQLQSEGLKVFPQPQVLKVVQDKGLQKQFYQDNHIPTAAFSLVENKQEARKVWESGKKKMIQKLRKGGYDGRGVTKLFDEKDFEQAFDAPSVMEEAIDFRKELAVIVARNEQGQTAVYDPVEMEFNAQQNLVEFLQMPADIPENIVQQARNVAVQVAQSIHIVGVLAVEMFLTYDDKILVNEIAPRPHNSGHQTIEGCRTSQYAQHLRAILGLPLGSTYCHTPSVMVNLLGQPNKTGVAVYSGLDNVLSIPGVYVHLYGKKLTKPFRKMGHITILHERMEEAIKNARIVQQKIKATTE